MTRFELHVNEWKDCKLCKLSETRNCVVFARGSIPCDILFVGQAPGMSEDTLGIPFIGPAGHKMDEIIAEGLGATTDLEWCLYNLVGCLPVDEETGDRDVEPEAEHIEACAPRLREFVEIATPRLIVTVGKLATTWLDTIHLKNVWKEKLGYREYRIHDGSKIPRVSIPHPSAVLRAPVVQQSLLQRRAVIAIRDGVATYLTRSKE